MAGIGNASANAFPLLLLAGSSETHLVTKGAFQEMGKTPVSLGPFVVLQGILATVPGQLAGRGACSG